MSTQNIHPDDLAATGRALYGAHWQGQLAHALGVGDRTLRRWLATELPLPATVEYQLYELLEERMRVVGGLVAFSVRLDIMTVLHNPSGAYFRIDGEDMLVLLHDRRFFHGYDMPNIEAGARAAVRRERARERHSSLVGGFAWLRA
jgi:hypothetical protein